MYTHMEYAANSENCIARQYQVSVVDKNVEHPEQGPVEAVEVASDFRLQSGLKRKKQLAKGVRERFHAKFV